MNKYDFYKKKPSDKIWWVDEYDGSRVVTGTVAISFDKKNVINLWQDYPKKLTAEQKALFDKENPYWAHLLKGRD